MSVTALDATLDRLVRDEWERHLYGGSETFTAEAHPALIPQVVVRISSAEWEALGSPDRITAVIEPGTGEREYVPRHA